MAHDTAEQPTHGRSKLLLSGALGFCSGLPLALSGSTLQAWLTVAGTDLKTIGALSLVGWPYLLKFLWAPALDSWSSDRLGRLRGEQRHTAGKAHQGGHQTISDGEPETVRDVQRTRAGGEHRKPVARDRVTRAQPSQRGRQGLGPPGVVGDILRRR